MPHFHTVTQINEIKNKTSYDLLYLVIKKQKKKKKKKKNKNLNFF